MQEQRHVGTELANERVLCRVTGSKSSREATVVKSFNLEGEESVHIFKENHKDGHPNAQSLILTGRAFNVRGADIISTDVKNDRTNG